ncbi:HEAT repeat domain-containing protein [Methanoregula sp.]|jgi:HEAT repeat protein|uniref:HEAT repeat domain-containing protein n=1 Tax=Methanoregula sp. TaxID=2052170 RepID=UPI0025CE2C65|nr:HEAT repeat domain-containing protein [Methanoregula sp.]
MEISAEKSRGEWYDSFPGKGIVYDLSSTALSAPDTDGRLRAVTALGKSGDPRAVRPLMDLVADHDPAIRRGAIAALCELKSGRPVEVLIERLRDRSEQADIRRLAAETLAAIRSTGALHGLREFSADADEDPELRSYAAGLLAHSGTW